jgi:hypothetical protein
MNVKRILLYAFALVMLVQFGMTSAAAQDVQATGNAAAQTSAGNGIEKSIWQNLSLFAGLDGSKQPQDLGINANMGARFSANLGLPISKRLGLGAQLGVGQNVSDAAVHVLDQIEGTSSRTQTFVTLGVFRNSASIVSWGLAYDMLLQQYYDNFTLGQVRGFAGYHVTSVDEVGVWFTKSARGQSGKMGTADVRLDPVSQANGYFSRIWSAGARTRLWVGVASGHHNVVWVLPDNSRDHNVLVYGADLEVPLNERFALSGSANFLTPTATGTVDAFLGITFFPGKKADRRTRDSFAPPQGVANNPEFSVNMSR